MKKILTAMVIPAFMLMWLLLNGCNNILSNSNPSYRQVTEYNGHFIISGSSAAMVALKPLTDAFSKNYHGVTFEYGPGTKMSSSLSQVKSGIIDIAVFARELKPEEKDPKLRLDVFLYDPIAVVTNSSVRIDSLTMDQIKDIYTGKTGNWSEITSANSSITVCDRSEITVCDRSEEETAKIAMRRFVFGDELKITGSAVILEKEGDMINAISSTPYSIGYYSAVQARVASNSRIIKINGVEPSVANVRNGSYRLVRPIGIATLDQNGTLKKFVAFLYSDEAKKIMVKNGYVPIEPKR